MSYLALARKYRPQTFDELIGQEFVSTSLKNALALGRIHHAYLFTGARGVGKTSAARIMAKALNCLSPENNNPCNKCANCLEITEGTAIDVVEIDGASNRGIDEIRQLREAVRFLPVKFKYKVYIIDEVHMLTEAASNALLKTLEEPPSYVVFIFATTELHKVLPTILSRCQKYDFVKIPFDDMRAALKGIYDKDGVQYDDDALNVVIRRSEGCMRDALSFSDQLIAYSSAVLTYENVSALLGLGSDDTVNKLYAGILREDRAVIDEYVTLISDAGRSLQYIAEQMIDHTRNLLLLRAGAEQLKKQLTAEELAYYNAVRKDATEERLYALFQLLTKLHNDLKYSSFARYTFEFGMFKAASLSKIIPLPIAQRGDEGANPPPAPVSTYVAAKKSAPITEAKPQAVTASEAKQPSVATNTKPTEKLSRLEQQWHAILNELKAVDAPLTSLLFTSNVEKLDEHGIKIVFDEGRGFQYKKVSSPDSVKTLKKFFTAKYGVNFEVEVSLGTSHDEKKNGLMDRKLEQESHYEAKIKEELLNNPEASYLFNLLGGAPTPAELKIIKNEVN